MEAPALAAAAKSLPFTPYVPQDTSMSERMEALPSQSFILQVFPAFSRHFLKFVYKIIDGEILFILPLPTTVSSLRAGSNPPVYSCGSRI